MASFQWSYMQCGLISDPLTNSEWSYMEQPGHKRVLCSIAVKGELYSEGPFMKWQCYAISWHLSPFQSQVIDYPCSFPLPLHWAPILNVMRLMS